MQTPGAKVLAKHPHIGASIHDGAKSLNEGRKQTKSLVANSHAERLSAEQIGKLVHGHYGMKTIVFDKEIGQEVLAYNTGNRRINWRKLQQLVDQMTRGVFINTGEPIIISREGVLTDGQHRLQAVVGADIEVDMDVRFGISREAFRVTDTGVSRTPGDVLTV